MLRAALALAAFSAVSGAAARAQEAAPEEKSRSGGGAEKSRSEGGAEKSRSEGGAEKSRSGGGAEKSRGEGGAEKSRSGGGEEKLPWEEGAPGDDRIEPDPSASPFEEPAPTAAPPPEMPAAAAEAGEDGESRWTDQGLGAGLGLAVGSRHTPGGLRISGAYLYRLSRDDWFDGAASFTIGSGDAACFRDRDDERVCDHGAFDGFAFDVIAAIRRSWPVENSFAPFVRLGAGLRFVRFSGDSVAGLAVPLIGGGGVAIDLTSTTRLVAAGQLELGAGLFTRGLGAASQLGLAVSVGVEFALR